eukprot:6314694-Heterocapsa_arctica.AAC.1
MKPAGKQQTHIPLAAPGSSFLGREATPIAIMLHFGPIMPVPIEQQDQRVAPPSGRPFVSASKRI